MSKAPASPKTIFLYFSASSSVGLCRFSTQFIRRLEMPGLSSGAGFKKMADTTGT